MPAFVKTKEDERLWNKAKDIAEEAGHKEDWPYIMGIYKKMKPDYEFKNKGSTHKAQLDSFDFFDVFDEGGEPELTPEDLAVLDFEKQIHRNSQLMELSPKIMRDAKIIDLAGRKFRYVAPAQGWFLYTGLPTSQAVRMGTRAFKALVGRRNLHSSIPALHEVPLWVGTSEGKAVRVNPPKQPRTSARLVAPSSGIPRLVMSSFDERWVAGVRSSSAYDHINFVPPQSVADAAARGLEYRQKASPSNRGGLTPSDASEEGVGSGVQRASDLKNRKKLSPDTINRMVAFFSRHQKNKKIDPKHKAQPWNDKGFVSWLLWGGDPAWAWAKKVKDQMDAADSKKAAASGLIPIHLSSYDLRGFDSMLGYTYGADDIQKQERIVAGVVKRVDLRTGRVSVTPHELQVLAEWKAVAQDSLNGDDFDPDPRTVQKYIKEWKRRAKGSIRRGTGPDGDWSTSVHRVARRYMVAKGLFEVPFSTSKVEVLPPRKEYPFEGYIDFQGLAIHVENVRGSTREGVDPDGTPWKVTMTHHYGEVDQTEGVDHDPVDIYVGPNGDSPLVVVVRQQDPKTKKYDEDKVMVGFNTEDEAIKAYKAQYNSAGFYQSHKSMPIGRFLRWCLDRNNRGKKVSRFNGGSSSGTPGDYRNELLEPTMIKGKIRGTDSRRMGASYPDNLGFVEMMKFWEVASDAQQKLMNKFIETSQFEKAWKLLQQVTGVKLHPLKAAVQMADTPVLAVENRKGYAMLHSGGTIKTLTDALNTHMVRWVPPPGEVPRVRGATKAFSFHWSNAQGKWSVISAPSSDFPWGIDGAEFILFVARTAVSPLGKVWTLPEMKYVAQGLHDHPGYAFAVRSANNSKEH